MKPIVKHRVAEVFADMGIFDIEFHADHATGGRYTRHEEGWSTNVRDGSPVRRYRRDYSLETDNSRHSMAPATDNNS